MASRVSRYTAAASASFDERRIERQVVSVTRVTARRPGQAPQDARMRDISIYGCRLITGVRHTPGERLMLQFGGAAAVSATVVWCDGAVAGCRFEEAISGGLVRAMTLSLV